MPCSLLKRTFSHSSVFCLTDQLIALTSRVTPPSLESASWQSAQYFLMTARGESGIGLADIALFSWAFAESPFAKTTAININANEDSHGVAAACSLGRKPEVGVTMNAKASEGRQQNRTARMAVAPLGFALLVGRVTP